VGQRRAPWGYEYGLREIVEEIVEAALERFPAAG
jgi:hypothetical protein